MQESQPSPSFTKPSGQSRGKLILALGISSLLLIPGAIIVQIILVKLFPYFPYRFDDLIVAPLVLIFLLVHIFGISAWRMANKEFRKIREGTLTASKQGVTKAGKILGRTGIFVVYPFVLIAVLYSMFSTGSIQSNKDAVINDLNNLFANAYQYRIRPSSMGGGQGSYRGYAIPATLSENENGRYTINVIHLDTLQFIAMSAEGSRKTIEVKIGPDGKSISWEYTGSFK